MFSRAAACATTYVEVASSLGLSVSFSKTKSMVVGAVLAAEKCPLAVTNGASDWVDHFPYLDHRKWES